MVVHVVQWLIESSPELVKGLIIVTDRAWRKEELILTNSAGSQLASRNDSNVSSISEHILQSLKSYDGHLRNKFGYAWAHSFSRIDSCA